MPKYKVTHTQTVLKTVVYRITASSKEEAEKINENIQIDGQLPKNARILIVDEDTTSYSYSDFKEV